MASLSPEQRKQLVELLAAALAASWRRQRLARVSENSQTCLSE
jgi:hypothetical protein